MDINSGNYKDLRVWQKSILLTNLIYDITLKFPKEEIYGLASQLRRCAVSVPSNIAEGSVRTTKKDFANFIGIARGSLAEIETQLIIAQNRNYISEIEYKNIDELTIDISKMLLGLHRSLKRTTIND